VHLNLVRVLKGYVQGAEGPNHYPVCRLLYLDACLYRDKLSEIELPLASFVTASKRLLFSIAMSLSASRCYESESSCLQIIFVQLVVYHENFILS
jgi:hypothetical protein